MTKKSIARAQGFFADVGEVVTSLELYDPEDGARYLAAQTAAADLLAALTYEQKNELGYLLEVGGVQ